MVHLVHPKHEEKRTRLSGWRSVYVLLCIGILAIVIGLGYLISSQMKDGSILRGGWSLMQDYTGYNRRPERPDVNLCFPGHATVECKELRDNNQKKQMQDLCVGDIVRTGMGWSEILCLYGCMSVKGYLCTNSM